MRRMILVLLLLPLLLAVPAKAADVTEELAALYGTEALTDGLTAEQQELLGETNESDGFLQNVQGMFSNAMLHGETYLQEAMGNAAKILAVCLLCGLCGTMAKSTVVYGVNLAGVLAVCTICISDVGSLFRLGSDTMQEISAYGTLMLPVLGAAAVSSGAVTGAPMIYGLAVLFSDFLMTLFTRILLPMLYILLGLAVADCVSQSLSFGRIRGLFSWVVKAGMKAVLYGYIGFLTVTQVISGTSDAMTVKAAKLTISGVVPVVGSIISDASETLLVSASLLKNTIGTVGLLAVLVICILPFLRIGIHLLTLKVAAALSEITAPKMVVSMIDAVADTMNLLLGMLGSCVLIQFIAIVCCMKAVGY